MCDIKRMEFDDLPDDVLLEVQRRLPPSALKNSTLVKKQWRAVAEDPSLWEKFTVKVYSKEDIQNLSIKRLRRIEEIGMNPVNWDAEDWNAFFRAVLGLARLKKIDGTFRHRDGAGVQLVDSSLFGRSLAKLEVVVLSGCTDDHIQELFSRMLVSTQIKKLKLVGCRLFQLQPGLFGKVLSRLEDLDMTDNGTTKHQVEALFTEILNKSSLKRLVLKYEDSLVHVDPGLFAKALSKVEEVRIRNIRNMVDDDQLEALLTELSFGTHQLKRLQLYGGDFTQMEPGLVAHVLSRLEELFLSFSDISDNQKQAIFTEMSHLTQLKKISFCGIDLSQVGAELLANVLAKLEDVDLWSTYVTAEQMVKLFTEISRNSQLKALDIGRINLVSVDPEILAKAVTRLEAVNLENIRITRNQSISLFSEMSQTMQMKKINFNEVDLSSVEPEDFARALIRLEEVSLFGCNITHDQAMALFREMALNTHIKKLDLGVNVSRVDPEILASAITKVKEVILIDSILSQVQIDAIFTRVLGSENKLKKLDLRRGCISAGAQLDPQIVRKVQEKLKGELKMTGEFQ